MGFALIAILIGTGAGVAPKQQAFAWNFDDSWNWTTPIAWRCYPVSQWFGSNSVSHRSGENAYAIDVQTPSGTPVFAMQDGTVLSAGWESGGGGIAVRIAHRGEVVSVYAHLSRVTVYPGQRVVKGLTRVGYSGATGGVTGAHLHFALKDRWGATGINMTGIPGISRWQVCP